MFSLVSVSMTQSIDYSAIFDTEEYYQRGYYETVESVSFTDQTLEKPRGLLDQNYARWKVDVEHAANTLTGVGFEINTIKGPYDLIIDVDRRNKSMTFFVTSCVDGEKAEVSIDLKDIIEALDVYRAHYLAQMHIDGSDIKLTLKFEEARKGQHHRGTDLMRDALNPNGIETRYDRFARALFNFMSIVTNIPSDQRQDFNKLYAPTGCQ